MEVLNKTLKKLTDEEYDILLNQIPGGPDSKPYHVLTLARTQNLSDQEVMELLAVNPSTYYTLKSRLKTKVASILSTKVDNPISELMDKVGQVPATLYGTSKAVAIRALKDLEKQLAEYDLSNELIVVYETLARLHLYSDEYDEYDELYNKYVAFSLAVSKANKLYYEFFYRTGILNLSGLEDDLEYVLDVRRRLHNVSELYDSHRLFVLYNTVRIYDLCVNSQDEEELRSMEIEVDDTLKQFNDIFDRYELDTFYQKNRFIAPLLYFIYYQRTGNNVRAAFYYEKLKPDLAELSKHHIYNFHLIQVLMTKVMHFQGTGNEEVLLDQYEEILANLDVPKEELYHYVRLKEYSAIVKHYTGDHLSAAKSINDLRNEISLRNLPKADVECKLFQALEYCIGGEEDLCMQLVNSANRQAKDLEGSHEHVKSFIKLIKTAFKKTEVGKKVKRMQKLAEEFEEENVGNNRMLWFINLNDQLFNKMTSPFKYKSE